MTRSDFQRLKLKDRKTVQYGSARAPMMVLNVDAADETDPCVRFTLRPDEL
jgi:hypothetical protein